jgi:hypothetical protein
MEIDMSEYEDGKRLYADKKYVEALNAFDSVPLGNSDYEEAQVYKRRVTVILANDKKPIGEILAPKKALEPKKKGFFKKK